MTTPEHQEPAAAAQGRVTRPEVDRAAPNRKPSAGAASHHPAHTHSDEAHEKEVLAVNEAIAGSVRSAYEVLGDTIKQGRRAAESFRAGEYNVRAVPGDVRAMATRMLGLARQLSSATFDICEALLSQADGLMTPPEPGSTEVPVFHTARIDPVAPASPPAGASRPSPAPTAAAAAAPHPAAHAAHPGSGHELSLSVRFDGKNTARAHTVALARPAAPTAPSQIACDGLALRGGGAAPITSVAFESHPSGQGLAVLVVVPHDQPSGIYAGSIYCNTQPLPLGQLVIEIE